MDPKHSHGPDRIDYREDTADLSEVHAAILRENPEPSAAVTPIPLWLITICGIAVAWAGAYLGMFNGGFRGDIFNERLSSPDLLFPHVAKSTGPAVAAAEPSLAEQGKAVFANCVPCHQTTGMGLPGTFPPLAKSEIVLGGGKRMIAIILKGLTGPFQVNGAQYNNVMQPWEGALNDKKIAAVASYVRSSFGNDAPQITPAQVAAAKKEFADRKTQWTEAELLQIPADATLPDAGGAAPAAKSAAALARLRQSPPPRPGCRRACSGTRSGCERRPRGCDERRQSGLHDHLHRLPSTHRDGPAAGLPASHQIGIRQRAAGALCGHDSQGQPAAHDRRRNALRRQPDARTGSRAHR